MLAAVMVFSALPLFAQPDDSHRVPAPSTAEQRGGDAQRRETLAELWQRRVLPPDATRWEPEDMALLRRIRRAEAAEAIRYLVRHGVPAGDSSVAYRPVGSRDRTSRRLTKAGFDRYVFLRSQDAIDYFTGREIGAKLAFQLTDADGRRLFDKNGQLTESGDDVYDRVLAGREARWKTPSGELAGNRRHPPPKKSP